MTRPSDTTIELIRRLVGFDTVSRKSNRELIGFVRDYLADLGIDSRLVPDATGAKANLFATIGPAGKPGVVLSGHTDVVPVDGQDWSSDPFTAVETDGKLFGRGTADMKSFLAVALALAPEMAERDFATPISLAFSYDEEIGCVGVRGLLAALADMKIKPQACIVGEPTGMKVVTGHKGKAAMRCAVRGYACHSAMAPYGVNAVEVAAEIVSHLRTMGRRLRNDGPFDSAFDPPFGTVHTGVIAGGTALNIVPSDCSFDFEFRTLPGQRAADFVAEIKDFAARRLLPEMQAVSPAAGFAFEELSGFPGLDTPEHSEVAELAKSLSGSNVTQKVSFGTEAGLYHEAGIPAVVCGPGNIAQAHKPDEYVDFDQVARCEAFMRRLMNRLVAA
ncbi:MAG TPA: acetylornithine deacetylase [Alphaproteobacteria bacterium]|jgi:acetylornithine deacetylase|nr:acetylornithine deacetylase [Alphaproteobacteria bacterium]